ncbi:MAG: DUF305 domain-containing protein [Geodermatophilaceae bacterium]|nr:DUF305 domain-containing protein [Geodermatophilaceae bacterium]
MKLHQRTAITVAALSAAAIAGGGATYAATQVAIPSAESVTDDGDMMSDHSAGMNMNMGMGSFTDDAPFDAQFLDQMIVHHEGAIMSTQAMIADSDQPELRELADDILTSQQEQITQMQSWRNQWYPDLETTTGMMGDSMMGDSMMGDSMMGDSMMGGGADTERMYLQMMIVHHQLAVDMAERAQSDAVHPQLQDLAVTIEKEQAEQITLMRGYLGESSVGTRP